MGAFILVTAPPKVRPFREVSPEGEMYLNFHRGQMKVWDSQARFVVMLASTQGGKTVFGPHWLHREMAGDDTYPGRGPGDYLAATSEIPLLRQKMLPEMRLLFEEVLKWGVWKAADKVFESHEKDHGAAAWRIIVGSGNKPESLESGTIKAAWLDEAGQHQFERQSWEAVQRRVAINQGRILLTTTPYEWNWLKTDVYDLWKNGDPDIDVIQFDALMNPAFPKEEYERQQRVLPPWKFNMFYRGMFERPAGLIYDAFDEETQVIQRFDLNDDQHKEWPRYVGHDFGLNNTAALWFAVDPTSGYIYIYRAYLAGELGAYDHAQKFKQLSQGEMIMKRVGGSHQEQDSRDLYTAAGWPIMEPRTREVEAGILGCYGWMQQNKLFCFNDVKLFLDEIQTYSRKLDENYQPTEAIDNKSRYHLLDSMRYILSDFNPERVTARREPAMKKGNANDTLRTRAEKRSRLLGITGRR